MWTRSELKQRGKAAFKENYWRYVVVSAVLAALLGACAKTATGNSSTDTLKEELNKLNPEELKFMLGMIGTALLIYLVFALLIKIFITNPIMVGAYRFFIQGSNGEQGKIKTLFSTYKDGNFGKIFITMFLRDLYLALWSCLLVIPGIIKTYSYKMVPYILADNPGIGANEAITLSRKMMNGNKMKAFVLDLSFIGWILLSAITLGVVGVFYVNPYIYATSAELYKVLKEENK